MSSTANKNDLYSPISHQSPDDTEPTNPIEIDFLNEILESKEYIHFINAIDQIPENTVGENPDAYTRLIESFISEQFLALCNEALPEEFEYLKERNQGKKGKFVSKLQEYIEGHDGITQLAGVIISMTLDKNKEFFKSPDVFTILGSLVVQHLTEIISDNLNEEGLLSENILQHFGNVLLARIENKNEYLSNAVKDFLLELGGKKLRAVFKVGSILKQALLEKLIENKIGKELNFKLVPALLFINLYASKKAYDTMQRYSSESGIIGKIAQRGMQSLVERYASQIELRHAPKDDSQIILQIRTKEILTNYTYAAVFLIFAVGNMEFRKNAEQFNYDDSIQPSVEASGMYIRLSNDLGGLLLRDNLEIDAQFKSLEERAKDLYKLKPLAKVRNEFLKLLELQNDETRRLFYAYIKDLSTGEENTALDYITQQQLTLADFLLQLKLRTLELSRIGHEALGMLEFTDPLFFDTIDNFRKLCEKLYDKGADFDTKDAKNVIKQIIKEIMDEKKRKMNSFSQVYVEA